MAPSTSSKKDLGVITLLVTAEKEKASYFCWECSFVEIIFLNDGGLCWWDFFRLHWGKWFSDVTGTNTIFNVEVESRKLSLFGRRFWWEQTAVNHVVWRNFPQNRKISNGWLRAWWSSIRYPLSIAESSSWKEIFLIDDMMKFYWVSNSTAESPIHK